MATWADHGIAVPTGAAGEIDTTCPKCSAERKKKTARCLSVNLDRETFCCHHCGWAGGLGGRSEQVAPGWRKPAHRLPDPKPIEVLPGHVLDWFADRGIARPVLELLHVGWASVYMPQVEGHAGVMVFPYERDGVLVNRKYRTLDKQFRMDTGAERILWGLDDIDDATLYVVEGEIDRLSVAAVGLRSCVSVPDGAPAETAKDYSSKFSFLDSAGPRLDRVKKIVLAVDNDGPGKRLEDELARRLGRERCWRTEWPEGCKDANDVLVKHGAEDLRWFLEHAAPYPIEGVFTAHSQREAIHRLYHEGFPSGVSTGWPSVDPYYTVRPGEFTVMTGIPSSGKSSVLDALLVNLARLHGWGFGVFSPENQPLEDHMARMAEKYLAVPFGRGPTARMTTGQLDQAVAWMTEHFWWILPDDEQCWEIEWILARAKELVYRHGIRGLVIDPWNELEPQRDGAKETETQYISHVLRTVRQFGRQHGVHVWIVVHPVKLRREDNGKYPVPTLYDCAASAHWRNKADNGLCVWRDLSNPDRAEVDIHVQKIRFRQVGHLGRATLHYDPVSGGYIDPAVPKRGAQMELAS